MDAINQSTTPEPAETALDAMPVTSRLHNARRLEQARHIGFWWQSRRQVARRLGVPDSSFRYSLRQHDQRCQNHRLPRPLVEFCESTAGLEFLQQLLVALHLVFGQANDCGLRSISQFLRLSGLDEFLPPSFGAQQAFAAQLETELDEYGHQQEQRLAAQMPPREITVCEDETFHPQICLVAIEPVSDYLLLEQYAPQRDAETWNHSLDERLADWPVTICQATSDEAGALLAHAEQHLGAHHSPDLFHVQQDLVRATSVALAGQTRRAHQAAVEAEQATGRRQAELAACQQQCPQSIQVAELQSQAAAAEVLARARSPDGVWGTLSEPERQLVETQARRCADLFQRSSSCVEGHNGQLSLRHHALHRLTARKLGALRVLHNFLVQRPDGTTAAERFFGARPRPLFTWLVSHLPLPARPRSRVRAA